MLSTLRANTCNFHWRFPAKIDVRNNDRNKTNMRPIEENNEMERHQAGHIVDNIDAILAGSSIPELEECVEPSPGSLSENRLPTTEAIEMAIPLVLPRMSNHVDGLRGRCETQLEEGDIMAILHNESIADDNLRESKSLITVWNIQVEWKGKTIQFKFSCATRNSIIRRYEEALDVIQLVKKNSRKLFFMFYANKEGEEMPKVVMANDIVQFMDNWYSFEVEKMEQAVPARNGLRVPLRRFIMRRFSKKWVRREVSVFEGNVQTSHRRKLSKVTASVRKLFPLRRQLYSI